MRRDMGRSGAALFVVVLAAWSQTGKLGFEAAGPEFIFDTGVLRGKLGEGGRRIGLSQVVHAATGTTLSSSMGWLGHYRVFTRGRRYGDGAWRWPGEARLNPNGEVEVFWPPAADRPFELGAIYRWRTASMVEVETRVAALEDLRDFESFLATYLTKDFNFSAALAGSPPRWVEAGREHGVWQMFPRDGAALGLVRDGRWKIPPSPVDWAARPELAQPIAIRRAPELGLVVVVMASGQDCFAVATPHHDEPHYSLYLSLFGRSLRAGETARARACLAVISDSELPRIERLYRDWLSGSRSER